MQKIRFEKTKSISSENCRLLRYTVGYFEQGVKPSLGIDPGVNFGITYINNEFAHIYHGQLSREEEPGKYAERAWKLLNELSVQSKGIPCIIEGAAYHKHFGQVGLAEVRIGFYLSALISYKYKVKIVPPATIRKVVFQNHLRQAGDEWPQLQADAAASLSMALYGTMI